MRGFPQRCSSFRQKQERKISLLKGELESCEEVSLTYMLMPLSPPATCPPGPGVGEPLWLLRPQVSSQVSQLRQSFLCQNLHIFLQSTSKVPDAESRGSQAGQAQLSGERMEV